MKPSPMTVSDLLGSLTTNQVYRKNVEAERQREYFKKQFGEGEDTEVCETCKAKIRLKIRE